MKQARLDFRLHCCKSAFVTVLIFAGIQPLFASPRYSVVDLSSLTPKIIEYASMNNVGDVLFYAQNDGQFPTSYLYKNGTVTDLTSLIGPYSIAQAINDNDDIAGLTVTEAGRSSAPFLLKEGKLTHLYAPRVGEGANVDAISDSGDIVGSFDGVNSAGDYTQDAYLWKTRADYTDLSLLPGIPVTSTRDGLAIGVNFQGDVVGMQNDGAALWSNGEASFLPTPEGGVVQASYALSINFPGQIVGACEDSTGNYRATEWQLNGPAEFLPVFHKGTTGSQAESINDIGASAGYQLLSRAGSGSFIATLWQDGRIYDLNTLLQEPTDLMLTEALSINDAGEILCVGSTGQEGRYVLLIPGRTLKTD